MFSNSLKTDQAEPNGKFELRGGTTTAGNGGNGENGIGGAAGSIASYNKKGTNQTYIDSILRSGSGGNAESAHSHSDASTSNSAQATGGTGGSILSLNENVTLSVHSGNITAGNGGHGTSEAGQGGAGGNIGVGNS